MVLALNAVACGGGERELPPPNVPAEGAQGSAAAQAMRPAGARTPSASRWPSTLAFTAPMDAEPDLFLGAGEQAPAVGYLAAGTVLEVRHAPEGNRIAVRTRGSLRADAHVPRDRIGARVQRRGKLRNAPVYFGPNDVIRVLEAAGDNRMRVRAHVQLRPAGPRLGPFEGTYPTIGLAGSPAPADAAPPEPGTVHALPANTQMPLYTKPDTETPVVATLPALDPPLRVAVVAHQEDWWAIRAGTGPYVVGYVKGALEPVNETLPEATSTLPIPDASEEGVPSLLREHQGTLLRVASGATISFNGHSIATLGKRGYARELARHGGERIDAFVAVDDSVAVRGLLPTDQVSPAENASSQAGPTSSMSGMESKSSATR